MGIWIFSIDGELQFSTLPDTAVPKLLQNKNTRQWFQEMRIKLDNNILKMLFFIISVIVLLLNLYAIIFR